MQSKQMEMDEAFAASLLYDDDQTGIGRQFHQQLFITIPNVNHCPTRFGLVCFSFFVLMNH